MRVHREPDAAAFLAATRELRAADPILTNLPASIALSVVGGRSYDAEHWWVVRDDEGTVVGCSVRTAPYRLVVSPMPTPAAVALGQAVAIADPDVPGANGPAAVVDAFYTGLASAKLPTVTMRDVVYVLESYAPARGVAGSARRAVPDDLGLVADWTRQFQIDAGLPIFDVEASVVPRLAAGSIWLWEVDGSPVSMAGHADLVESPAGLVGRIGPVYTPELLRGNGFGSAITSALIDELQPRTSRIMLFADAANPTSNRVYVRLGFLAITEVVETALASG